MKNDTTLGVDRGSEFDLPPPLKTAKGGEQDPSSFRGYETIGTKRKGFGFGPDRGFIRLLLSMLRTDSSTGHHSHSA